MPAQEHSRKALCYSGDMADQEWQSAAPLIFAAKRGWSTLNNEYARSPERLALYRGERLRLAASVLMLAADFDSSALFTLGQCGATDVKNTVSVMNLRETKFGAPRSRGAQRAQVPV